ncbi:hypothetical protein PENSPDRAFT_231157 [Peniophora sp. CONT]|nr:hypothetical protein PENSPDRAFT_231157 [Peniophora sp. CONT]
MMGANMLTRSACPFLCPCPRRRRLRSRSRQSQRRTGLSSRRRPCCHLHQRMFLSSAQRQTSQALFPRATYALQTTVRSVAAPVVLRSFATAGCHVAALSSNNCTLADDSHMRSYGEAVTGVFACTAIRPEYPHARRRHI